MDKVNITIEFWIFELVNWIELNHIIDKKYIQYI